ncbi:hypothetical protein GOHSU_24_00410 [Gordonia hirsuta DSM 44140 = NBRC 16056]|uniref:Glycoprotein n=1 Tax=Gordonia hirsuta DSM 44140 = NBRC 16056 TaxID=1121927 RepID=L7LCE6_9ACTN|nr:DUF6049 family protein [Gordonia hirsuta]GAC57752.1 hypothetical protein GOHSU_24_00410 [Gordonia hirsuta DSM 44140 = NBRC 16056]
MAAESARRSAAVLSTLLGTLLLVLGLGIAPLLGAGTARAVEPEYARLSLTEITPSTVTSADGDTVRVRGRLTNTFDRPISEVRVRLQAGSALTDAVQLRTGLMASSAGFPAITALRTVSGTLDPGQSTDVDIEVPIAGPGGLQITDTGVYPLLVNVIGTPESVGVVSVADSRTLLPVLSLPADPGRASGFVDPVYEGADPRLGRDGSLAPDTSAPAALTMIWPLAAPPQLAPGGLGGRTEPVRLISDDLAASLRPEGRLGSQLESLSELTTGDRFDERVRSGLCLAIDPDLLVTVHGMTLGYLVSDDPVDPRAATSPGAGQEAARAWLGKLRKLAQELCVTALPFAQAGLDSLAVIGDDQLTATAVNGVADIVDALLGVTSLRGITIPAVGTLSQAGREVLVGQDRLMAAVASSAVAPAGRDEQGRYQSGPIALQTYAVPISAAIGAAGTGPVVPSIIPGWQQPSLRGESPLSRRQSAAAALAFPALTVPDEGAPAPIIGRSAMIMPPTYWAPTPDDAATLLGMADLLIASGTARPVGLAEMIEYLPEATEPTALVTPGDVDPLVAGGFPVSSAGAQEIRADLALTAQLQGALVGSRDTVTSPQTYVAPLQEDMLRAVTTPQSQTVATARELREMRVAGTTATLRRMVEAVALLDPGGRYTLASERSPLLLIVRNDLALPIRVRMDIQAPAALNVGDVGVQEIPPIGTRQIQIGTHASSSESATVQIAMVTSTGVPLSDPVTLEIYTNAYGKPLFWITVAAATVLVLLTARRLWHRFRGQSDPADEDRPEPDAEELRQASTPYEERLDRARHEHVEAAHPEDS